MAHYNSMMQDRLQRIEFQCRANAHIIGFVCMLVYTAHCGRSRPGSYCHFSCVIVRSSCHLRVTLWLKTLRTWCLSMTQHRRTDSRLGKVSSRGPGRTRMGTMRSSRLTGLSNSYYHVTKRIPSYNFQVILWWMVFGTVSGNNCSACLQYFFITTGTTTQEVLYTVFILIRHCFTTWFK